ITRLEIPTHRMNTKFVNNLPSYWAKKAPGNVGNNGARGKKVICFNCRGEGHVSRQCKEPKRKMDSQYFKDKMKLMEAKEKGPTLDAEAEAFLTNVECTVPYDEPLEMTTTNMFQANHKDAYDSDVDEGPNANVAFMENLTSKDVNEVRQEQGLVIQRNQRNAKLLKENELLKSTVSAKDKSVEFLKFEKEKVLTDKKELVDSYLVDIVSLRSANRVTKEMLQRFNMPTHTIPMISKKPKRTIADLHQDILGIRNIGLGFLAKRTQPVLYDGNALLDPTHTPVSVWDSDDVLVHQDFMTSSDSVAGIVLRCSSPIMRESMGSLGVTATQGGSSEIMLSFKELELSSSSSSSQQMGSF
nr:hypothetical protein [Tanacetum cinerariifolium]